MMSGAGSSGNVGKLFYEDVKFGLRFCNGMVE